MGDLVGLAVVVNLYAYAAAGWGLAMRDLPALTAESREESVWLGDRVEWVYRQMVWMVVGWPLVGPLRFLRRRLRASVEAAVAADPLPLPQPRAVRDQWYVQRDDYEDTTQFYSYMDYLR